MRRGPATSREQGSAGLVIRRGFDQELVAVAPRAGVHQRPGRSQVRARLSIWPALAGMLLLWASACASTSNRPDPVAVAQSQPSSPAPQPLESLYQAAIRQAQGGAASRHPLLKIAASETSATVVAWTDWGGYRLGPNQLGIDVWVTKVPEVQELCRSFPVERQQQRLQQLLGLPTSKNYVHFVVMEAKRSDIFRPCPDPDPAKESCGIDFPVEASPEHRAWIDAQASRSYRVPDGFPWTRLGYTFDWAGDRSDDYGASEFVVKKGATVTVKEIAPTAEYCRPAAKAP